MVKFEGRLILIKHLIREESVYMPERLFFFPRKEMLLPCYQ